MSSDTNNPTPENPELDEDWARWEATFRSAKPVLPDVAMARIEAAVRDAMRAPPPPRRTRRFVLLVLLWLAAVALSMIFLDERVAEWVHRSGPKDKRVVAVLLLKPGGTYWVTLLAAALVALVHRRRWRGAMSLVLAGPLVGIVYTLAKWMVGRARPYHPHDVLAPFELTPFPGGLHGLIHAESGYGFPSGHAAMAFATATCLSVLVPRWRPLFVLLAGVVGLERVMENAHYVSDVVAGGGIGVLCGLLALRLAGRWFAADRISSPFGEHS